MVDAVAGDPLAQEEAAVEDLERGLGAPGEQGDDVLVVSFPRGTNFIR